MKIVSWNVERGYHPKDTINFLKGLKADVYLLTEIDRGNKRTKNIDFFKLLSQGLEMKGKFAREFKEKILFGVI